MSDPLRAAKGVDGRASQGMRRRLWQTYVGVIVFVLIAAVTTFWAFNGLFAMAGSRHWRPPMIAYGLVPLLAFITANVAYFMREVRKTLAYPILEIGIGLAASAQAVSPGSGDLARLVALLAGARVMADGIERFFKFSELKASGSPKVDPAPASTKSLEGQSMLAGS